eukprot:2003015-Amphidinium_carterae.1
MAIFKSFEIATVIIFVQSLHSAERRLEEQRRPEKPVRVALWPRLPSQCRLSRDVLGVQRTAVLQTK